MIVEYLRYEVDPARQEAFIAAYGAASGPLLESPYCRAFEMCRCVEEPASFILRIEWTSADDHLKGFRASEEFRRFFAAIRPYLGDIKEMRHYERLLSLTAEPEAIG